MMPACRRPRPHPSHLRLRQRPPAPTGPRRYLCRHATRWPCCHGVCGCVLLRGRTPSSTAPTSRLLAHMALPLTHAHLRPPAPHRVCSGAIPLARMCRRNCPYAPCCRYQSRSLCGGGAHLCRACFRPHLHQRHPRKLLGHDLLCLSCSVASALA